VTKQPFLTDFPLTIFATAKRRLQAAIRQSSAIITRRSLSGYAVLFEDVLSGDFLTSIDPTLRQRSFGHLPVFWAWLAQILEANASCQKAVGLIQSWCRTCNLPVPSSDTSSYCKARCRLSLSFIQAVHQRICGHLSSRVTTENQWCGFTLMAMDGSSVHLMDTKENQRLYPQPSVQKPGCGFPTMGIVGLLNLGHGGWEHIETCPHTQHDTKAAAVLATHLRQGDLLLADRAFCSYELIARSLAQGAHILMRLHQARARSLDWRKGKRLSSYERLVTWHRPQQPRGSNLTGEEWNALPATLELRLIKLGYENRAGQKSELIVVTTLTDPKKHCGIELADLYARRWDIELKLRDLKTTLGMERFEVKSPDMAHKTLWMSVIAFNLIRSLMQRAAAQGEQPVWHLSFKGVLDLVVASHESFRAHAGRPRKRAEAFANLLETCATKRIDLRPFRSEPRAVKRRPKSYQLLTDPRGRFQEIHHRSRYQKSA
jgi:Transposase DDE domain